MPICLNWQEVNNEKDFQRLSNHLFSFECGFTSYIPSSPYIGADQGWDGRYDGRYRERRGVFSIQAKWTSKNYNDACSYLKTEIRKEVRKAESQGVDHLIVTTNAELREQHVTELQALKGDELKSLTVWHREKLDGILKVYPYLCQLYFGVAQIPAFVPYEDYFADVEKRLLDSDLVGRDKDLKTISQFVADPGPRVLVVHAKGGAGKSHLLKEASGEIDQESATQVWFYRQGFRRPGDALQEELQSKRTYVFLMDDADRYLEEAKELIAAIRFIPSAKLILGSRSAGMPILKNELIDQGVEYTIWPLSQLDDGTLVNLLCLAAAREEVKDAESVVKQLDRNPYFIVSYGRLLQEGTTTEDVNSFYDASMRSVERDASKSLAGVLSDAEQEELLLQLATVSPFRIEQEILQELGQVLSKSPQLVRNCLDRLLDGQVLRRVGSSIRFSPDMVGDLYLGITATRRPEIIAELLRHWIARFSTQLISNLASAAGVEGAIAVHDVLHDLVGAWERNATEALPTVHQGNLEHLRRFASLCPDDSLRLMHAYVDLLDDETPLTLDDFGPVIQEVAKHVEYHRELLELIQRLAAKGLRNRYDNYSLPSLVRYVVSPISWPVAKITETMAWLVDQVSKPEVPREVELMAALAAKEVLAGAHEHVESHTKSIQIGERVLKDLPQVHRMRDQGMEVFRYLLRRGHHTVALDIAEHIGDSRMGSDDKEIPLAERIGQERQDVVKELGSLDIEDCDLALLSALHDLMMTWWLLENRGSEGALDILRRIPRSAKYRFVRYYKPSEFIAEDLEDVLRTAPEGRRWDWWWESHRGKSWQPEKEVIERLSEELVSEYREADDVLDFLKDSDRLIEQVGHQGMPPTLSIWIEKNPDPFIELVNSGRMSEVPLRFRSDINAGVAGQIPGIVEEEEKSVISALPKVNRGNLLEYLRVIRQNSIPYANVKDTLLRIASEGDIESRSLLVHCSGFDVGRENPEAYYEIVTAALHDGINAAFGDRLDIALDWLRDWGFDDESRLQALRELLEPLILQLEQLTYHGQRLVRFCYGTDLQRHLDYVQARIGREEDTPRKGFRREYQAIPFHGLSYLNDVIKSPQDFEAVMARVSQWGEGIIVSQFGVKYLVRSLREATDGDTAYLSGWIAQKLGSGNKGDFNEAASVLGYLELGDVTEDICLELLEAGSQVGEFERAKDSFHLIISCGAFAGPMSEHYASRRAMCERLLEGAQSDRAKRYLAEYIEGLSRTIRDARESEDDELI